MAGNVIRRSRARWEDNDIVLPRNSSGLETDTGRIKIGDGTTPWSDLAFVVGIGSPSLVKPGRTRGLTILRAALENRLLQPCRLVFVGSSTTAGQNASVPAKRFVNLLVSALQKAYPSGLGTETTVVANTNAVWGTVSSAVGVHGFNAGQGGTDSSTYLTTGEINNIAALNPRMVMHMIGSNDWDSGMAVATYKANVLAKITALRTAISGPCVQVLVQSYPKNDGSTGVVSWSKYGEALAELADADPDRVVYLDLSKTYSVIGLPGADSLGFLDTDRVHQKDNGHAFMADLVQELLGVPRFVSAATTTPPVTTPPVTTPPVTTPPAGTTSFVKDTFTGTDGVTINSRAGEVGATWTKHPTMISGDLVIAANRVHSNATGSARILASGVPASADYTVRAGFYFATVPTDTSSIVGVGARYSATDAYGYYVRYIGGVGWRLDKNNGTQTTLGTAVTPAPVAGQTYVVDLICAGSTISVKIDGTQVISATDTTFTTAGRVVALGSGVTTATTGLHLSDVEAFA